MANLLLLLTVSIGLFTLSRCYPTGAPQETCSIFTANHTGHSSQNSEPKYNILINPSTVQSGGTATVSIQGNNGDVFKGFFIQGRDEITNQPVGKFKAKSDVAQTRDCRGAGSSDSATHTNNNNKSNIDLEWKAPESFKGKVVFRAVVVKTYEIFWDNLLSSPVTVV